MIATKHYRLTVEELIQLSNLLTDTELKTLLYLKCLHPFSDSYKELDSSILSEHLGISRRSVQRFLKKFTELNLIEFELTSFKYRPINATAGSQVQKLATPGSPTRQRDRQSDPSDAQTTAGSPKRQQDRIDPPETGNDATFDAQQTLYMDQTIQTPKPGAEDQEILDPEVEPYKEKAITTNGEFKDQEKIKVCSKNQVKDHLLRAVLPFDLINRLETLGIQIDQQLETAIAAYHISQAYGAVRHVENTYETISNPRSVFLYQLPKQKIERGPKPLSREFLEWYQTAIADGLVVDYPPEHLPKDFTGEPKVKLAIDKYWLENWEKVRDRPQDYRKVVKIPLIKFESIPKTPVTQNTTELLRDPIIGPQLQSKLSKTHNLTLDENGIAYEINEEYEQ
jgi:hypothetical protein